MSTGPTGFSSARLETNIVSSSSKVSLLINRLLAEIFSEDTTRESCPLLCNSNQESMVPKFEAVEKIRKVGNFYFFYFEKLRFSNSSENEFFIHSNQTGSLL